LVDKLVYSMRAQAWVDAASHFRRRPLGREPRNGSPDRHPYPRGLRPHGNPPVIAIGYPAHKPAVGKLPLVEAAIADDGEILVRGPSVFKGY
jgi:hypothetical protein